MLGNEDKTWGDSNTRHRPPWETELLKQAVVISVRADPEPDHSFWVTLQTNGAPGAAYTHGVDRINWMDSLALQAGMVRVLAPNLVGGESLAWDPSRKVAETFAKGSGRA